MTAFQCHLPICSGLPASSLVTLPIVPNSGGDLWWFAVKCGGLWWFAVVCGGLGWFAVICLLLSFSHTHRHSRSESVHIIAL